MSASHVQKLIAGILVFSFAFLLVWLISAPTFDARWRNLKYGSTQADVQKTLGAPTSTGANGVIGAGDQPVVSWEYNRGMYKYSVDFDYIGPGGTPVVYRKVRLRRWEWPSWPPWRAKARA